MTSRDRLFLILFDRDRNTADVEDLGHDLGFALQTHRRYERELAGKDVEVVLVGSASLDTLRRTHSSYFDASAALAPALVSGGS